mmetsp:Transcript_6733/g.15727  ORF Transcript_6733/g.15727 Transcript_6733/m.15727 type:complete len:1178 (-) Transcript_6733:176-3709(-)
MHIQEIVIDGFKSYAKRTVVDGFDPMFNAITGLNGSGKSNILDSICFVLGISKLEQVRAGSLQELVYKQGQAGVTRASVTIVFKNKDKKASPVGYEAYDEITVCRQVAIGGRNKYLINGHVAQQNRVQNLFHSVQLNINNPHFLIMQGRITKVINMSPQEILGLIAEAAGTKMYESKKEAAMKTIEKKQAKVEEIQKILSEDITPSLEKLRKERAQYMTWSAGNAEKERLERFVVAADFARAEEVTQQSAEEMERMQQDKANQLQACDDMQAAIEEKEQDIAALHQSKKDEMGEEMRRAEQEAAELSKALVQATAGWQHAQEGAEGEKKAVAKINKSKADLQKQQASRAAKVGKAEGSVETLHAQVTAAQEKLADLERQRQALQAGCDADSKDGDKSLADQLKEAKARSVSAESELKQLSMRVKHLKVELKERSKTQKSAGKEFEKLQAELDKAESAASKAAAERDALSFDPKREEEVGKRVAEEEHAVQALREVVDRLAASVSNLEVEYTAPRPGFDRRKVKGIVASLMRLKEAGNATALEVACGAKLYQLVVADDQTGKELLSGGNLRRRVTIIPLNKIDGHALPPQTVKNAHKAVGPDRAETALSLVGYDAELENAMRYVLGRTLVCKDVEAAKACAFTEGIRVRSVTVDGDLFDPAGTLTGGTRGPASNSVLLKFGELMERRAELKEKEGALAALQRELAALRQSGAQFSALDEKVSLAQHQATLVKGRLQANPFYRQAEELREMEAEVAASDEALASKENEKKTAEEEAKRLEKQVKEYASSWEKLMEGKDKEVLKAKDALAAAQAKLKATREENEAILLEAQAAAEEMTTLEEQLAQAEEALKTAQEATSGAEEVVTQRREAFEAAEAQVKAKRDEVKRADKAIAAAGKEVEGLKKKVEEARLAVKKLEHAITRFDKETVDAHKAVEAMLKAHPWIKTERQLFGKPGSDYDWSATDPKRARERMKEVAEQQERLGKKINKKVMGMFDKAEQEYQEVMDKKRIVENDKMKIEAVMQELDEKKNAALKTTWSKVNRDFSSIFHTLLPNAKCKLEPPEGGTVLDGLVLRVGFGDCWKDSLSELSGGQRSLLALSLILALLLFKPAPMYILDEIDAALDLSHTQNIGSMLKTHFKNSQFIIVSLKEGMFNNANVLFRTKFVDGVSTVTRTTPGQR